VSRPGFLSSLKARIALFVSTLFVLAIWGMAFRSADKLRQDEERFLLAQQTATTGVIADGIDAALRLRMGSLHALAAAIRPEWMADRARLHDFLGEHRAIYTLFERGLCIIGKDGTCLLDRPAAEDRAGTYFGGEEFFRDVMGGAKVAIGKPRTVRQQPVVVIAVPIADRQGGIAGVLAGTLDIADNDVFHAVHHVAADSAVGILVVSPRDGLFVAASDRARTLQPVPPPGRNPLHDRSMLGFEGAGVTVSSKGVEELAAVKKVPSASWFVVTILPTERAYAPIRKMVRGLYLDAAILSLAAAALVWLFVRRQLATLDRAVKALEDMTGGRAPFHPLPVAGSTEITQLLEAFNSLQERIVQQQLALGFSETRFRQMFENSSWVTYLIDPATMRITDANQAAAAFWGYSVAELRGMPICDINTSPAAEIAACHTQTLQQGPMHREWHHRLKNGELRDVVTYVSPLPGADPPLLYVIAFDISERKQREEQDTVRNRIFELLARGGDLDAILGLIVRYVEQTHSAPLCSILLVDADGERLQTAAAGSLPEFFVAACNGLPVGEGIGSCGTAAYRGERVVVADIASHPFWAGYRELAARAELAACWSEPIRDSAGAILGTLAVYRRTPGAPDASELDLLQQAANLAAIAIERKRSEAELHLASSVFQASDEAIVVTDAENHVIAVNPAFTRVTGYSLDDVRGRNPKLLAAGHTPKAEYRAMWHSLATTGQWQGEIWNRRKDGEEYAEWLTINTLRNAQGEVYRHIGMFADITEKKRTAELVWRQANYDSLTGLPNRNLFYDRLHQDIRKLHRTKLLLALLFIDLDRFKEVNDAYGHDAGDLLLKETAARIAACVRDSDTVSRLSGDEFTVVLPGLADISRVEQVAKDIVETLAQPFHLGQNIAYVSASVGIALYPTDAEDAEALLKSADQAMYAAKEHGRNGFSYFTDSMQSGAQVRRQLAASLRNAMAQDEFEIFFQPIVDMRSGRVVKAEALLRWHHPEHGLILPAAFIPLAEEIGLIGEIGDWVFRESARIAKAWSNELSPSALVCPIQISVNKSPRQFRGERGASGWLGYLDKIGLPSNLMAIEITEGLLLDDNADVTRRLDEFRDAGIQVALDDFGTGYSAMSYLNKFRVDYVKIDQSFVQGVSTDGSDRAIVEAIVAMAHKLGLKVIAEGVETEAQRDFLLSIACDYAQGFLFAKPMPQIEFEAVLFGNPLPLAPTRAS